MEINKKNIELFNELKSQAQAGQGSILLLTGESGFGKSYLIKQLIMQMKKLVGILIQTGMKTYSLQVTRKMGFIIGTMICFKKL